MRLLVKKEGLYTYPDVMVICGELEFAMGRMDTVTNPTVIVEVLSKSTRDYDRGFKFHMYRTIDTFVDYLLIEQQQVYLEYFHKLEDGRWILVEFIDPEKSVTIESIGLEIPIARIYHKVDWFAG
jgi:Uma2 family endonuclease